MAQIVEFEGNQLEFPDDATPEEIGAILNQQFPAQQQTPQGGPVDGLPAPVQPQVGVAEAPAGVPEAPAPQQVVGGQPQPQQLPQQSEFQQAPPPTQLSEPSAPVTLGGQGREVQVDNAMFDNLVDQFRLGLIDIGTGILQRGSQLADLIPGVDTEGFQQDLLTSRAMEQQRLQEGTEEFPVSSLLGRGAGQAAALPVPGVSQGSFALRVGSNAGVGALVGFLQPTADDEDTRLNSAIGALAGGGFTALSEPFARLIRKTLNAEKGVFKKEDVARAIQEADELKIPLFADDVMNSKFANFASQAAEEVPLVGTSTKRLEQAAAQKAAVEAFRDGLEKGSGIIDGDVDAQLLRAAKMKNTQRLQIKDRLWREAAEANPGPVPLDNYRAQIGNTVIEELVEHTGIPTEDAMDILMGLMRNDMKAWQELRSLAPTSPLNPEFIKSLIKLIGTQERGFLHAVRSVKPALRKELDKQFRGDASQLISPEQGRKLQIIKEALDLDIETAARASGNDGLRKFQIANDFSQKVNQDLKKSALPRLAKRDAEPEAIMSFLRSSDGVKSRNQLLYRNLTPEGRQSVKFAIVNDALKKSVDEQGNFLANKFTNELLKAQGVTNVFFRGQDAKQLRALQRVLSATKGSSRQFGNATGTNVLGRRILQPGTVGTLSVGAGFLGGAPAAAGVLATAGGIAGGTRLLLQTKTGMKLLTAVGSTTPGTAAHDKAMQAVITFMTRAQTSTFEDAK